MIKKIVSGGQTGVDRAALDFAVKYKLRHGGWAPKGRLAEDGPIPETYSLQEMPTADYAGRTEQNVIDADATLIISHGPLTGGTAYTRKMAMAHGRPWFHVDLNKMPTFQAAMLIKDWVCENEIDTLNIAGPRASEDPQIYGLVTVVLELVLTLTKVEYDSPEASCDTGNGEGPERTNRPHHIDGAVDYLVAEMSMKDKSTIARLPEADLLKLNFPFGVYIRNKLLYPRNDRLLESCRQAAQDKYLHWDQAPAVIIKALWRRLRKTHALRVVD
jgi:hypothetical protein